MEKEERIQLAVSAVRQRRLKIREAALEFEIPRSTLSDRVNDKWGKVTRGPPRNLTDKEEEALVNYLEYMGQHGFPMTRNMTRCFVREIVKKDGRETSFNLQKVHPTSGLGSFFKRHSHLKERKPQDQDRGRAAMSNKTVMEQYFTLLESVMREHNLLTSPSQIFNCDETGWTGKEASRTKVTAAKESTFTRRRVSTTDHITAHLFVSADGKYLPTMVIYKGALPHRNYTDGIPDSWAFAASDSGYMDTGMFQDWFEKVFIPNCGRARPVLLVMDYHDSHISLKLVERAIENNIILMGLPAHTTHLLQPLDVKLIGPLKSRFSSIANNLGFTSANPTIGKSKFPILLKYSIDKASPSSVQEAFSASGLYPVNRHAVADYKLVPPSFGTKSGEGSTDVSTCETCGSYAVNPLVTQGLIPEKLAKILVSPPVKRQSENKKRRVVSEARVLTGNEMLQILKEKEENLIKKQEEKEQRIQMRLKRQAEKEKEIEEREVKKQKREEYRKRKEEEKKSDQMKRAVGGRLAPKRFTCGVCGERGRMNDEANGVIWFCCEESMCGKWYHEGCLNDTEKEYLYDSMSDGSEWFCAKCTPWLYEEE